VPFPQVRALVVAIRLFGPCGRLVRVGSHLVRPVPGSKANRYTPAAPVTATPPPSGSQQHEVRAPSTRIIVAGWPEAVSQIRTVESPVMASQAQPPEYR
jgi:hypothetical protein